MTLPAEPLDPHTVTEQTRRWIASVVIGLRLCPFAQRVFDAGLIRCTVSAAADAEALLADLVAELRHLAAASASEVETTLLIHPRALSDFLDYNDFLGDAENAVRRLGLQGVVQIASFHPDYRFADTEADAVENYTNRSPYPMLHLLREESITRVAGNPDDLLQIPEQNIATLRGLGKAAMLARLRAITGGRSP